MLTRDVRFEGWGVLDWTRLLSLLVPPADERGAQGRPSGGVFVVHDGRRVLKLLHTRAGRLEPVGEVGKAPLSDLASKHEAGWAIAFHTGALEELMERLGARVRRGDDVIAQSLKALHVVRELQDEGALEVWPSRLRLPPLPGPQVVARALDALCPPGRSVALGLFEGGELWSALVLRRGREGFDLVLGPDELRAPMGLLSGDFRRDYWHLLKHIERLVGPLSVGLFTEVETLRRLLAGASPGAWARAVAVRSVVISPMSAAVAVPLGVDAISGVADVTGTALRSLLPRPAP